MQNSYNVFNNWQLHTGLSVCFSRNSDIQPSQFSFLNYAVRIGMGIFLAYADPGP